MVIFVISKCFLPTSAPKRLAIANDQPLFAMLTILTRFQSSIFLRNANLLEVIQSKQKLSATEFLLPPYK